MTSAGKVVALALAAIFGLGLAGAGAGAGRAEEGAAVPPLAKVIRNEQPPFLVAAEVNKASREYREGDALSLRVASEQDAYLYVWYQQADGKAFQIFPNQHRTDNKVKARQALAIPEPKELWTWQVGPPYGEEIIKVIASRKPLKKDFAPNVNQAIAGGRFVPLASDDVKGVELELGEEQPGEWAETDIEIRTYDNDQPPEAAIARRVGVFFGVSKHLFPAAKFEGGSNDLTACHRDAQKLARAMQQVGRLNDARVFTNEDATRGAMEEAITQWLPSVTRPGDTVVIHFSLHTGQVTDLDGDERDQLDEFMVPHDFISYDVYLTLEKMYQDGKIKDRTLLDKLKAVADQAGANAPIAFVHLTGLTDDLLARWLQRLTGRQVLIVSDSCNSAGLALNEKSGRTPGRRAPLDLMGSELSRLRGLGQGEQALLAAALVGENALERLELDMGVMTGSLVECLQSQPGPLRLEDGFQHVEQSMKRYFEANPNAKPTHPFMVNNCTRPVVLKP
jgi:hypothetical protein